MSEKEQGVESRMSVMTMIGLAILAVCYIGAIWNVFQVKKDEMILGKKVVRICHWQLEMGVRAAVDDMIDKYQKLHPDCSVIQIPLTEKVYGQWVTTQLIGRTAPDIIQIGMFNVNEYLGRYFLPLTDELRKPNHYNEGMKFKDTPWMDTFSDGLQNSYIPDLVDYYSVGFSQFNTRIFYNKYMFKRIVGDDSEPKTLEDLFARCDKLQAYAKKRNEEVEAFNKAHPSEWFRYLPFVPQITKKPFVLNPIASSRYQVNLFKYRYGSMLTADENLEADLALTGWAAPSDMLYGLLTEKLSLEDPKYRASNEIIRDMARYFPSGFMSIDRMDSGFSFVQGRSAMITSGSWDASSFLKQIADQPFGDIILEINGKKVSSASEVKKAVSEASGPIKFKLNREGYVFDAQIKPVAGGDLWTRCGFDVDDFASKDGKSMVPVVVEIDPVSPAANAGLETRKRFEVEICNFPPPSKNDPKYGKYYVGQVAEALNTGFNFGVVKFSKNVDVALDFLRFCTTPENNQRLNEVAQWIPAVIGAKPTPFLEKFVPNYKGYWGMLNFETIGIRSKTKIGQAFWPYVSREIDYDQFAANLKDSLPTESAYDFMEMLRAAEEKTPDKQIIRSVFLRDCMFPANDDPKAKADAKRRLASCWDTIVNVQLERARLLAIMGPLIDKRPDNNFSKVFFGVYDNLSSDKSAQGGAR